MSRTGEQSLTPPRSLIRFHVGRVVRPGEGGQEGQMGCWPDRQQSKTPCLPLPRSRSRSPRRRAHSPERRREERSVPTAYRMSNSPGVSRKRTRSRWGSVSSQSVYRKCADGAHAQRRGWGHPAAIPWTLSPSGVLLTPGLRAQAAPSCRGPVASGTPCTGPHV